MFTSSLKELQMICERNDIIFLQETWLVKQQLNALNSIYPAFYSWGISSVDLADGPLVGRPFGGSCRIVSKKIFQTRLANLI